MNCPYGLIKQANNNPIVIRKIMKGLISEARIIPELKKNGGAYKGSPVQNRPSF